MAFNITIYFNNEYINTTSIKISPMNAGPTDYTGKYGDEPWTSNWYADDDVVGVTIEATPFSFGKFTKWVYRLDDILQNTITSNPFTLYITKDTGSLIIRAEGEKAEDSDDDDDDNDYVSLKFPKISSNKIELIATANSTISTPIGYCGWDIYVNNRRVLSEEFEKRTLIFKGELTDLNPNTEYEIYADFNVYTGNPEEPLQYYSSELKTVRTSNILEKVYIWNGQEKKWCLATPYIYIGNKWVKATPYIYDGSEWK